VGGSPGWPPPQLPGLTLSPPFPNPLRPQAPRAAQEKPGALGGRLFLHCLVAALLGPASPPGAGQPARGTAQVAGARCSSGLSRHTSPRPVRAEQRAGRGPCCVIAAPSAQRAVTPGVRTAAAQRILQWLIPTLPCSMRASERCCACERWQRHAVASSPCVPGMQPVWPGRRRGRVGPQGAGGRPAADRAAVEPAAGARVLRLRAGAGVGRARARRRVARWHPTPALLRTPSAAPHLACRRGPLYALTHRRARRRWQRGRQGREGGAPALTVGTSRARSTGAAAALLGAAAGGGGGRGGRPARAGGALPAGRVPRGQPAAGGAGAGGAAAGAAHAGGQLCGRAGRGGRGHAAGHGRRHVRPARRAGRRAPARLRRQTRHLSAARNAGGGSGLRAWIGEEREELTRG